MSGTVSLSDWYRLGHVQRSAITTAIDHGQQVADPALRPVAAATAAALLQSSGFRVLRNPLPVALLVVAAVGLILTYHWWVLALTLATGLAAVWLAENQARHLRPEWTRAVDANSAEP